MFTFVVIFAFFTGWILGITIPRHVDFYPSVIVVAVLGFLFNYYVAHAILTAGS